MSLLVFENPAAPHVLLGPLSVIFGVFKISELHSLYRKKRPPSDDLVEKLLIVAVHQLPLPGVGFSKVFMLQSGHWFRFGLARNVRQTFPMLGSTHYGFVSGYNSGGVGVVIHVTALLNRAIGSIVGVVGIVGEVNLGGEFVPGVPELLQKKVGHGCVIGLVRVPH